MLRILMMISFRNKMSAVNDSVDRFESKRYVWLNI